MTQKFEAYSDLRLNLSTFCKKMSSSAPADNRKGKVEESDDQIQLPDYSNQIVDLDICSLDDSQSEKSVSDVDSLKWAQSWGETISGEKTDKFFDDTFFSYFSDFCWQIYPQFCW